MIPMLFCPLCRIVLGTGETVCPRDGSSPLEREPQRVPPTIATRFIVVEPFADGESGSLYLVDDKQTGRRGLLKVLRANTAGTISERSRLKRELMKQATLTHPALVVPLATGEADGCTWLFREWIDGVSLAVRLARGGAFALPEALSVAAQIASGLDELHRAGLLMRDLSPGHILTTAQPGGLPKVCLIDAGVASRISTATSTEITGKPGYVSPEHARGKLINFRSDLYSLGVVLYEMLTGKPLTQGSAEEQLEAQRSREAPALRVEVPSIVASLVAQLLVKEPRERPFSAQQVRRTLEPFLPEDTSNAQRVQTAAFVIGEHTHGSVDTKGTGTLRPTPKKTLIGFVVPGPAVPTPSKEATQSASSSEMRAMAPVAVPPPFRRSVEPAPNPPPAKEKEKAPPPPLPEPAQPAPVVGFDLSHDDVSETVPIMRNVVLEPMDEPTPRLENDVEPHPTSIQPTVRGMPVFSVPIEPQAEPAPIAKADVPPTQSRGPNASRLRAPVLALAGVTGFCAIATGVAGAWIWTNASTPAATSPEPPAAQPIAVSPPTTPPVEPTPPAPEQPVVQAEEPQPAPSEPAPAEIPIAEPAQAEPEEAAVEEASATVPAATPPPPTASSTSSRSASRTSSRRTQAPSAEQATPPAPVARTFEQLRDDARAAFQARRFADAARIYEQAANMRPRDAAVWAGLGAARLQSGSARGAIEAYRQAITIDPRNPRYHVSIGRAFAASGDQARARQAFTHALSIDPNHREARTQLEQL